MHPPLALLRAQAPALALAGLLVACNVWWPLAAQGHAPVAGPQLPLLTQAQQVRQLGRDEAGRSYPVRVQGVVTCFDPRSQFFFVQDETAGVYVFPPGWALEIGLGEWVEIAGISGPGRYTPVVLMSSLRRLGQKHAVAPRRITLAQLASGGDDSQWVEVEATVRRESEDWGHLLLTLAAGEDEGLARVLTTPARREGTLVDARVRVRGVAAAIFNGRGQMCGMQIVAPTFGDVTVLNEPARDPFAIPVTDSRSVIGYPIGGQAGYPLRVRGIVTYLRPGQFIYLKDGAGPLRAELREPTAARVGDEVDIVGYPVARLRALVLEDARVRLLRRAAELPGKPLGMAQALSGEYDGELVALEAVFEETRGLSATWAGGENGAALALRADQRSFLAFLPRSATEAAPGTWEPGSRVSVTGICVSAPEPVRRLTGFHLLLRSPADVQVLSRPPWWNPRRLAWGSLIAAGVLLAGLVWIGLLRRRVARRTAAVRQRETRLEERYRDLFENAHDIVFTCDRDGRLTSLNRAGEVVLGYSRTEALQLEPLAMVADSIRARVEQALAMPPTTEARPPCELELIARDGRRVILEVNARWDFQEGQATGLRGIARDITPRKEAEEALQRSERNLRQALEQRAQLARDLHDDLIQSLYAVGLGLEDCRQLIAAQPRQAAAGLARASEGLNHVIRDVRAFILGLDPESLQAGQFAQAVSGLVEAFGPSRTSEFDVAIDPHAASLLDRQQTAELLHIAREAISNSVRHAGARATRVSLQRTRGGVRLEVQDDGCGFDPLAPLASGHGLRNIEARARTLQARLELRSQPRQGTSVVLDLPTPVS